MLQGGASHAITLSKVFDKISRRPMVAVFLLLSLGVVISDLSPPQSPWIWIALVISTVFLIAVTVTRSNLTWYLACLSIVFTGAWQHHRFKESLNSDQLYSMASDDWQPVVLEGIIESQARWRPDVFKIRGEPNEDVLRDDNNWQTTFDISVLALRDRTNWVRGEFGKMSIVTQGRIRDLLPGDQVRCHIQWQQIGPPTNPGQFDYQTKSLREGIRVRGRADNATQLERLKVAHPWRLDRLLSRIVRRGDETFHRFVPFDQASMASALVINQRDQVEYQMQESLLATGTIHMLAISGMHIDLLAITVSVICVLVRLPRTTTIWITIFTVLIYTFLCGGNPPVARAAILVVTLGIFKLVGKTSDVLNLLGFAAVCIMLHRPVHWLEVGTQLSFLSVAILILIAGDKEQQNQRMKTIDDLLRDHASPAAKAYHFLFVAMREMLRTSMWICVLLMPLILYRMNVVSPIAIILNLVLWLPMTAGLLSGLLLLLLGTWLPWVGYPIGFVCGSSLWISDQIVRWSEKIPMGHFWLPAPSFVWLVTFYVVIALVVFLFGFGSRLRKSILAFACVWLLIGIAPSLDQQIGPYLFRYHAPKDAPLVVTFIDVGHGTSVLIQTPDSKAWLYDAGRMGDSQRSSLGIASVLWHSKLSRIDGVFLSHADSDHFNAIPGLAKRFAIQNLVTTDKVVNSHSRQLIEILTSFKESKIPIHRVDSSVSLGKTSSALKLGTAESDFAILHPPPQEYGIDKGDPKNHENDNSDSLCLLIEYAGKRILLPGDLESPGMEELLRNPAIDIDILMAPHHGSVSKDPQPIINWSTPEWIVISGGSRAKSTKVKNAFASQTSKLLITAEHHAIRFTIHPDGTIVPQRFEHPNWVGW